MGCEGLCRWDSEGVGWVLADAEGAADVQELDRKSLDSTVRESPREMKGMKKLRVRRSEVLRVPPLSGSFRMGDAPPGTGVRHFGDSGVSHQPDKVRFEALGGRSEQALAP